MLGYGPGITRRVRDAVKIVGKFLLWALAYAAGAALIFFLARRPEPPVTTPATDPVSMAPAATSSANQSPANETSPSESEASTPRDETAGPPALPSDETINPAIPPRRVKSIRIPRR